MKPVRVFLLLISFFIFSLPSHAQQLSDTLRQQANEVARKLAAEISLDDARVLQVRRLAYERLTQEKEVTQLYKIDKAMQANKLRVIQEDFATKLKGAVTAAQYSRYLAQYPSLAPAPVVADAAVPSKAKSTPAKKPAAKPKAKTLASPKALTQRR
jgi:biopolymer transport protein ExbD